MIRVVAIEDGLDQEGGLVLYITGHADAMVCAGCSAIWHTMLAGFAMIAKRYPKQLSFRSIVNLSKKKAAQRRRSNG